MGTAEDRKLSDRIEELLRNLRELMANLFRGYGIPSWDAEDLIQESLIVLLGYWEKGLDVKEGYFLGILRYKCLYYLRRRYRRYELSVTMDPAALDTFPCRASLRDESRDQRLDFKMLTAALPRRQRKAIRLRRLGKTFREISEAIPCTRQIAYTSVNKAIARLQKMAQQADWGYHSKRNKANPALHKAEAASPRPPRSSQRSLRTSRSPRSTQSSQSSQACDEDG